MALHSWPECNKGKVEGAIQSFQGFQDGLALVACVVE
jgi:hypothetical protein